MKYIMCQPSNNRFKWEVEVAILDLMNHGVTDIVVLFLKENDAVIDYFKGKYDVEIHVYTDKRYNKEYIPSIKPYLMYRYLSENPEREKETYFYMDSDMVFRQLPDYSRMSVDAHNWYGSNCNGYMNYDYLKRCTNAEDLIKGMANIAGVSRQSIRNINADSIGAQYVISKPTAEYFEKVYMDSIKLWQFVKPFDTNFQKWTVEMYATLWNMLYFDITPHVHEEMDFVFPTDDIDVYETVNILHNAGVTADHNDLFRKSDYIFKDPLQVNLDYVNKNKASYAYVQKMNKLKEGVNGMAKKEEAKKETAEGVKYEVVKFFTDLQDDDHPYKEGHTYPRNNKKADPKRVEELSTTKNKRKEVLIKPKGE